MLMPRPSSGDFKCIYNAISWYPNMSCIGCLYAGFTSSAGSDLKAPMDAVCPMLGDVVEHLGVSTGIFKNLFNSERNIFRI